MLKMGLLSKCRSWLAVSVLLLSVFYVLNLGANTNTRHYDGSSEYYETERQLFMLARSALKKASNSEFEILALAVSDYPLYPYLRFERLKQQITAQPSDLYIDKINAFHKQYQDATLSYRLTKRLQKSLAEKQNWGAFLQASKMSHTADLPCEMLAARFYSGEISKFDDSVKQIWEKPGKHPALCQQVFVELEKRDAPRISMIWTRIHKLLDKGKTRSVQSMLHYLSTQDKKPLKDWIKAYRKPSKALKAGRFSADTDLNRRIIYSLMQRWARKDAMASNTYWQQVKKKYGFSAKQRYGTNRIIARMAAYDGLPEAHQWLHDLPEDRIDLDIRKWRVRSALRSEDWPTVLKDIDKLPQNERKKDQWQYWKARSLQSVGQALYAQKIYAKVAEKTSYHGFLAADRLDLSYRIKQRTKGMGGSIRQELESHPQLIQAREYQLAGLAWEGRREWMSVVAELDIADKVAVAELAEKWSWSDRAVFTIAKTGFKDALSLRFPTPYVERVNAMAEKQAIDPAWIYGVIRRESGFVADIKSPAGAIGLMQLMPATAKDVAKRLGRKRSGDLTDVANNIELGSTYLRYVLNRFDNHQVLATAAYNAGPYRVKRWLPVKKSLPTDVWVDTIPYSETRRYVRAVTAYTTIFEWRLMEQQVTPLRKRMMDIVPPRASSS